MTYLLSKNYEDKTPVFLQDPYIDGTPQVGNTLTARWFVPGYDATDNDWSVAYQWYWGAADTTLTEEEFDETGQTFICTSDHLTGYLSCRVAVTNPSGTVVKFAANVGPVTDYSSPGGASVPAPSFSQLPVLVGTPQVGRSIACEFSINQVEGVVYDYSYTWYRDEDGVDSGTPPAPDEEIGGISGSSYTITAADQGKHLKCRATASNLAGSVQHTTNYSAEVQAADNTIPPGAIVIDSGWLATASNGGPDGPWILKQSGGYYYLTTDVTMTGKRAAFYIANNNITLDLNGHTITYDTGVHVYADYNVQTEVTPERVGAYAAPVNEMGKVGICLYLSWVNTEIAIPGAAEPVTTTIKNGSLIGTGTGTCGHGIWGHRSNALTIRDMRIESGYGRDSHAVCFINGGATTYTDSIFISHTRTTRNRQAFPATLFCGSNARPYVARCVIIGGNAGLTSSSYGVIENNVISQSSWHTNGWGLLSYGAVGITVRNNVIIPLAGRGIYFDNGPAATDNVAHGNVVLAWEHPNVEYTATETIGARLNASCFKQRYAAQRNQFYNNSCLAVGGYYSGQSWGNNGVFATPPTSYRNTTASCIDVLEYGTGSTGNQFFNNTLRAVFYGAPTSFRDVAAPIAAEGPPTSYVNGGNTEIYQNDCFSNDIMVLADWDDGGGRMRTTWLNNSFTWQDGQTSYAQFVADVDAKIATLGLTDAVAAAADGRWTAVKAKLSPLINTSYGNLQARRAFWFYDYYGHAGKDIVLQFANSTFGESVSPTTVHRWASPITFASMSLKFGRTATVIVLSGGLPVANATVSVTPGGLASPTPLNTDVTTATTDSNGYATLTFWDTALTRAEGNSGAPAPTTVLTSTVAVAGVGSAVVTHASIPFTINLV